MATQGTAEPESRWLLRWLERGLVVLFAALVAAAFLFDWSLGRLGNAYQLVGLGFAALALPVLSPSLAAAEVRIGDAKEATKRWLAQRRERLRVLWTRLRGKQIRAIIKAGTASATAGRGGVLAVGHAGVDRKTVSERDWLNFLNDQLDVLRDQVRSVEQEREADRAELDRKLNALRTELQEHTLSVTREGWTTLLAAPSSPALESC